jgi:hypothetical protein
MQKGAITNRRIKFQKRGELFIGGLLTAEAALERLFTFRRLHDLISSLFPWVGLSSLVTL